MRFITNARARARAAFCFQSIGRNYANTKLYVITTRYAGNKKAADIKVTQEPKKIILFLLPSPAAAYFW